MMLFLILLPFAVFAALMVIASAPVSLFAAAAVTAVIILRDGMTGRSIKLLPVGSMIVFIAVGLYVTLIDRQFSSIGVRIAVDAGVLAIALGSLAFRFPFTLQYALESVDADMAQQPGFLHANYIITLVWIAAFVMMMIANMLMVYIPSLPLWVAIIIAFAARNSAVYFTRWYPQHRRAKAMAEIG